MELLRRVKLHLAEKNYKIVNVDATIIAQAPKLSPYREAMRENLAKVMEVYIDQVSVKATTEEHLGFTGKGEGIAAHAVCLIERN